jgi:hypothetical protein
MSAALKFRACAMTKGHLVFNVVAVVVFLLIVFAIAMLSKHVFNVLGIHDALKDFATVFIAIAAAYLAFCFQRRNAFLESLRDLWEHMVETKTELIQYTHIEAPDQKDFAKTHAALSKTIDLVRGVYLNVDESDTKIGLYSFEPLHDMRKILEELGFTNANSRISISANEREEARRRILQAWHSLRYRFLKEFSLPSPPHPITEHFSSDPRRAKQSRYRRPVPGSSEYNILDRIELRNPATYIWSYHGVPKTFPSRRKVCPRTARLTYQNCVHKTGTLC